jgi:hypothetical protein
VFRLSVPSLLRERPTCVIEVSELAEGVLSAPDSICCNCEMMGEP